MLYKNSDFIFDYEEQKLVMYIRELVYKLYNNVSITINCEELIKLLEYLTSEKNISSEMTTAIQESHICFRDMMYQKEIEHYKNKIDYLGEIINRIKEYSHQEIVRYTESIKDYIDDDKEGNKHIIGELKEEREHWKDIERIIQNKSNEELYMNYWEYGLYE